MALNIKNHETEELARKLGRRRKRGITWVVTDALRQGPSSIVAVGPQSPDR